ncbi:MAG TPA: TonB-dependent receptor, partial [Thermodesulfobacteriota bacterium]|nr:TonB-dependent receptor [Thermodesulfobacteriota bacterium]
GDKGYRWNLDGQAAYTTASGAQFYLAPRYYKEKKSLFYTTFTPGVGNVLWQRREDGDLLNLTLGSNIPLSDGSRLQTSADYERFDDVSILDIPQSPELEQKRHAVISYAMAESQWDKPIGEKHLVTLGGIVGRQTLRQDQVQEDVNGPTFIEEIKPGAEQDNYEAYIQDDIFCNSWLEILPGLRYQYDTGFGSFLAPKVNLMIIPADNVRVRLGYGRGYRVPNLKERYYFFDHTALGYIVLGNPDLQPEKSNSIQVGAEGWWNSFNWDVNFFFNDVKDLIDVVLDQELSDEMGLQVFQYTNIKSATILGAEFAASYGFLRYFNLKAGYTYLWARDTSLDTWLPNRPKNQIKGGLDVSGAYPGNTLSLRVIYQSSEYVDEENTITSPGWTTVDVKLNQNIGARWTAFAGIDNVFDVHRSPSQTDDLRPVVGRYIYVGVRTAFQIGNKQTENKQ